MTIEASNQTPASTTPRKRLRVIVVDDQDDVREIIAELVRYSGYEVVGQARDGAEAVAQCAERHPDVVIMDITMPKMNGIDAMRAITKAKTARRVMLMSGGYNEQSLPVADLAQLSDVAFVPKPFDIHSFTKVLDNWTTELSTAKIQPA